MGYTVRTVEAFVWYHGINAVAVKLLPHTANRIGANIGTVIDVRFNPNDKYLLILALRIAKFSVCVYTYDRRYFDL